MFNKLCGRFIRCFAYVEVRQRYASFRVLYHLHNRLNLDSKTHRTGLDLVVMYGFIFEDIIYISEFE